MDGLKVEPVENEDGTPRLFSLPGQAGFVGYRRARKGETPDVVVPGGFGWIRTGAAVVPNNAQVRRALRRGDIALAKKAKTKRKPPPDPPEGKSSKKGGE